MAFAPDQIVRWQGRLYVVESVDQWGYVQLWPARFGLNTDLGPVVDPDFLEPVAEWEWGGDARP